MSKSLDETVFVAPRWERYHTDRTCQALKLSSAVFEEALSDVDELPLCKFCSSEYTAPGRVGAQRMHEKLQALDPDEIR